MLLHRSQQQKLLSRLLQRALAGDSTAALTADKAGKLIDSRSHTLAHLPAACSQQLQQQQQPDMKPPGSLRATIAIKTTPVSSCRRVDAALTGLLGSPLHVSRLGRAATRQWLVFPKPNCSWKSSPQPGC